MSENNLISIIVPVYNIENYIKTCIESIIKQTYTEIEIILVDDGSKDRSGSICDFYAQKDSRIHVIHKVNGGLSDARNAGLEYSHGSYIMFADGDDHIAPEMCEKLLNAVLEHKADIGICNYQAIKNGKLMNPENQNFAVPIKSEVISGRNVIEEKVYTSRGWTWVVAWNKLYRRELFQNLRFQLGKVNEDEFIFFDIFSKCDVVVCLEDVLYYYVLRDGSIMKSAYSLSRLDCCEAYMQRADKLINGGYSAECIFKTIKECIGALFNLFDSGRLKEADYHNRYREIINQFRGLGLIRLLQSIHGLIRKIFVVVSYIDPRICWRIFKVVNKMKVIVRGTK